MTVGVGPQLPQPDPRGALVFEYLPDELQVAEDSRQWADYEQAGGCGIAFHRPATTAERELLEHLGHTVPDVLDTRVQFITRGIRNRTWPALTA